MLTSLCQFSLPLRGAQYSRVAIPQSLPTFSHVIQEKWVDRMLDREGIVDGAAKETSWKLVVEWLVDVYTSTPGQMVRKARKQGSNVFKIKN
jgi:hypothetical protein